ncbi:MAG: flippase-like domain-containing protein [Chitinispirillia bacterium]|nr:flippase-like domain-containing protein [Chitinispirillia bacterium]
MQLSQEKDAPPKSGAKKAVLRVLRAALAIAPLVWIYASADAGAFVEVLGTVSVPLVAGITALVFVNMALQGAKWWALIRRFAPELPLARAVSVHMESVFYSIALPSAVAQDIVKSVMLSKTHDPSVVWASSWLARLLGFFSLLIFSFIGIISLDSGILPPGFRVSMITAVAVIVSLGALSFSKTLTRPLRAAAAKAVPKKIMAKIENLRDGIYAFKHAGKTLAQTFALSTVIHFLVILSASLVVYAVSGKLYLIECLAFVPLVEIMVVSIPLTPGGIGVREALMALLFTQLGFTAEQTASYVTISLFAGFAVKLTGGAPILYRMAFRR